MTKRPLSEASLSIPHQTVKVGASALGFRLEWVFRGFFDKNRQRELLEEFKVALFKDAGLEDSPKREKIWEKAVSKFGTDHPDRLAKIKDFVSDVAELA